MTEEHKEENIDLRECLALERTTLANERTFLSYARTAVMVFVTGISVFKLLPEILVFFVLGWAAVLTSIILFFVGLRKYVKRFRSIASMESKCSTRANDLKS